MAAILTRQTVFVSRRFWLAMAALVFALIATGCGGGEGHGSSGGGHASSGGHGGSSGHGGASGHGGEDAHAASGAAATGEPQTVDLLALIAEETRRHDPKAYIEVDLGSYRTSVKQPGSEQVLVVQFRLYGVLAPEQRATLEKTLPTHDKRLRDAILTLVKNSEVEQLADPNLGYLKLETVDTINRVLRSRIIKEVAFSDYSLEPA